MPLEGLWWADDLPAFVANDKSKWKWTMMIMQPSFIGGETIDAAIAGVQNRKNLPGLSKLRFESFTEGRCAQILHIGPFSEEGPNIERVHDFVNSRSSLTGKHHEGHL